MGIDPGQTPRVSRGMRKAIAHNRCGNVSRLSCLHLRYRMQESAMPPVERRSALRSSPTVFDRLSPFPRAGPRRKISVRQRLGVQAVFTLGKNGENGRKLRETDLL